MGGNEVPGGSPVEVTENSSVPVAGTGGDPNAGDCGVLHKAEVVDHHAENAASADGVPRCAHEKETPKYPL